MKSEVPTYFFRYDDVLVAIDCRDVRFDVAAQRLLLDFANFPKDPSPRAYATIRVVLGSDLAPFGGGVGRTPLTPRYKFLPRLCDHGGGTLSRVARDSSNISLDVSGEDTDHVYEVAYVGIVALLGWELEKRGFVRLHALGVRIGDEAALFQLPPKGGKSTLALECMREGIEVLGDEVILVRGDSAFAFPIRVAVSPSVAATYTESSRAFQRKTFDQKSLVALAPPRWHAVSLASIVFQARPGLATATSRAGARETLRWMFWTCLGLGLPQMREFILRFEELPWLAVVFLRRFAFALRFAFSGKLLFSRGIEIVGRPMASSEIRPRLGWVRSSLEAISPESAGFQSPRPTDKASEERA